MSENARICILGAGAAGLSAAWYLRKRGYENVTILEQAARIGGKCHTLHHQGVTVDLGAALLMPDYSHVLAIASEVGATTCAMPGFGAMRAQGERFVSRSIPDLIFEKHGLAGFLAAGRRYLAGHRRHSAALQTPGFAGMHPDLALPFGQWAAENGLEPLLTQFQLPFGAFGYGDVARLPAGYVLRYISPRLFLAMTLTPVLSRVGIRWPRRFTAGFGEFWKLVAAGFYIRPNARVEKIDRDGSVSVTWTERDSNQIFRRNETFDALIVTCPPAAAAAAMEWSGVERSLFSQVRTKAYSVTACESTGIPETVSFLESPGGPGHLIQLWKPSPGSGVCAFYTSPPPGMSVDEIMARVRGDVRRIYPMATIGRILSHVDWPYFPHVDAETFAGGFFDDFEAMQGDLATWYGGSLPAFESVESVVAYSGALVDRMISSSRNYDRPVVHESAKVLTWTS